MDVALEGSKLASVVRKVFTKSKTTSPSVNELPRTPLCFY